MKILYGRVYLLSLKDSDGMINNDLSNVDTTKEYDGEHGVYSYTFPYPEGADVRVYANDTLFSFNWTAQDTNSIVVEDVESFDE